MENNVLSSARYFKREAAANAENANLGNIYFFERKEREAVNDMSVSFAQEEARSWEATEGRSKSNDDAELKMKTAEAIAEEEALRKATIQEEIVSAVLAHDHVRHHQETPENR